MKSNQPTTIELLPITPIISSDDIVIYYSGDLLKYLIEIDFYHEKYGLEAVREINQKILEELTINENNKQEIKEINEKLSSINKNNAQETKKIKENSRSYLNTFINFFQLNKGIEPKNAKEQPVKRQSVFYI